MAWPSSRPFIPPGIRMSEKTRLILGSLARSSSASWGVGNLFDHVTELLEIGGGNLSDLGTVFNDQHRAGPLRRGFGFDARDRRRRQFLRARKIERDHRAAPDGAGDGRSAARLLGEAIDLA